MLVYQYEDLTITSYTDFDHFQLYCKPDKSTLTRVKSLLLMVGLATRWWSL
jgi:hypothetical protein